jgi:hypothetical protein
MCPPAAATAVSSSRAARPSLAAVDTAFGCQAGALPLRSLVGGLVSPLGCEIGAHRQPSSRRGSPPDRTSQGGTGEAGGDEESDGKPPQVASPPPPKCHACMSTVGRPKC